MISDETRDTVCVALPREETLLSSEPSELTVGSPLRARRLCLRLLSASISRDALSPLSDFQLN